MNQPSSVRSVSSVIFGSVLPYFSWPALPISNSCHSMARPTLAAAAFITFTASGTTSRPISSPSIIPIFKAQFPSLAIHLDPGVSDVAAPGLHLVLRPGARVDGGPVDRRDHAGLFKDRLHLRRLRRGGDRIVQLVDDLARHARGRKGRVPLRRPEAREAEFVQRWH